MRPRVLTSRRDGRTRDSRRLAIERPIIKGSVNGHRCIKKNHDGCVRELQREFWGELAAAQDLDFSRRHLRFEQLRRALPNPIVLAERIAIADHQRPF